MGCDFERDAIGLIEKNPDVKFDIYFPPYSILHFVRCGRFTGDAEDRLRFRCFATAAGAVSECPACHDSERQRKYHDLGNYGDVIHHSPAIDLKILSWIASGQYVVDKSAPLASLERLKAQVETYRVER